MKVKFTNLATIKEAEIGEADLTLIVGDNSLGKTILLEAYALFINTMKDRTTDFIKAGFIRNLVFQKNHEFVNLSSILKESQTDSSTKYTVTYDSGSKAELAEFYTVSKDAYLNILKEKILMDPSSEVDIEVTHDSNSLMQVPTEVTFRVDTDFIMINLIFERKRIGFRVRIVKEMLNDEELFVKTILRSVTNMMNRDFYERLYRIEPVLFFPSERNMYKANALAKSADFISDSFSVTEKDSDMRYSESLFVSSYLNYISMLQLLGEVSPQGGFNQELHEILCQSIGGEPTYEDGIITSISQNNKKLPLNLFSTKQNRLVPYFMLSNRTVNSKFIIIEEPEAHMSLKSMFELVEVIQKLVERKRVILTSHSDVFVSLLNNMIKKNQTDAKVYELIEQDGVTELFEVEAGDFGYELSFMSEALNRLNRETREAFSAELNESDE